MKVQVYKAGTRDYPEPVECSIEPNIIVGVGETDTLVGKSVAQIDIYDEDGKRCRFFISVGRKNGKSFCQIEHNKAKTSVKKEVFGTFKEVKHAGT